MTAVLITAAASVLVALCGVGGALGASAITTRSANRIEKGKSDLAVLQATMERLDSEVERISGELEDERQRSEGWEGRARAAEQHARQVDERARVLTMRVGQLEAALRLASIPVPPPLYVPASPDD